MHQSTSLFHRLTAATLFLAMAVGCVGCSSDSSSSSDSEENIPMEELEYGATLRDDDDYAIPIEYDKRYLETDELKVVTDYFAAVQNEDADLFSSCIVDFYLDYLLENTYGGLLDDRAYVTQQHETFQDYVDGDYTFQQIQVTNCKFKESTTSGVDYLIDMFDELNGEGYSEEHMQDCKALTVQLLIATDDEEDVVTSDEATIFVVDLDGTYYVCP